MPMPKIDRDVPIVENATVGLPSLDDPIKVSTGLPTLDDSQPAKVNSDDFVTLTEDEVLEADRKENIEQEPVERKQIPLRNKIPSPEEISPFFEEEEKQNDFIDYEKQKIIPIGSEQSDKRGKIKSSHFDGRKNNLIIVRILRVFIFVFILFLFGLGIKNTFFPEQIYTKNEIEKIAQMAVGDTGFPMDKAIGFAGDFLKAYLEASPENPEEQQQLAYFYTGNINRSASGANRRIERNNNQKVIGEPKVINKLSISDKSAVIDFKVMLSDTDGETVENKKLKAHWLSFRVNVYYNPEENQIAIQKDSPIIIPNYDIATSGIIPNEEEIGNGLRENELASKIIPTIDGFIVAYTKVNAESYDEIKQYIPPSHPIKLIQGFGGSVKIAGTVENSIRKDIYQTDELNIWKADVRVELKNTKSTKSEDVYTSRYILTIRKTEDDIFLVERILPYVYLEGPER